MFVESLKFLKNEDLKTQIEYLRDAKKKLEDLSSRSICPYCQQRFPKDQANRELKIITDELDITIENYKLNVGNLFRTSRKKTVEDFKRRKKIEEYLLKMKPIMRKSIKDWRAGKNPYLPGIPEKDKKLWNDAMDRLIGNSEQYSNELDEDDFHFEIEEGEKNSQKVEQLKVKIRRLE